MQQENKPKKKNVLSKFDDVLGQFAPASPSEEVMEVSVPTKMHTAYAIMETSKGVYEIVTIEFNPNTDHAKIVKIEKEKFNHSMQLTLDNVRRHYVEDLVLKRKLK
jgi:hypothetical protein